MKKRLKIRVPKGVDLERFIDEIMGAVHAQFANYEVRRDYLLLTLVGDPASIARTEYLLKRILVKTRAEALSRSAGYTLVPKHRVASVLGKPLPLDLLTTLLDMEGIRYEHDEEELRVLMDLDELRSMVEELFERYQASRELFAGTARKVAAIASFVTGAGLDEVYTRGLELGVMEKGEDGRARLRVHKERALALLLEAV